MRLAHLLLAGFVIAGSGCYYEPKPDPEPQPKPEPKAEQKAEPKLVTVRHADTLAPEDFGIGKYVFEEKVPAGKVMVLRRTEERNGRKQEGAYETIDYTNGGTARKVVLVYDMLEFPFSDRKTQAVQIKYPGSTAVTFPGLRSCSTETRPGLLRLVFADFQKETVEFKFECFVEDYKVAKKRIPTLSAASPNETWTYCYQFEDK
ncbi:hypothetical protein VT84_26490 [Gemmata sp. SH-PL17]|uniref:hypothetical protein n=1 Tax=Gemmata sp. SH-PL17 TaxID=1630693 RepID=UPI00078B417C|nr:hypothetical protein [Gemmata sp. SH-PL17]AMV27981.1 hypothetical protein VT84_26490 [Gemmata sp. SH-PL17]